MSELLPVVYLARHGETAWTLSGRHTRLTDLPLAERGEDHAPLGYERSRSRPVIRLWSESAHAAVSR